jgi:predicted dinucleotide-binding enzyme
MNKRRLDIVGAGKVGKTLARLWNQNGVFEIGSVANRSLESSEEATPARRTGGLWCK